MTKYEEEDGLELDPFLGGNDTARDYTRPNPISRSKRLLVAILPRRRALAALVVTAILFSQLWLWGPSVVGENKVEEWREIVEHWKPSSPLRPPPPPPPPLEDVLQPPLGLPPPPAHDQEVPGLPPPPSPPKEAFQDDKPAPPKAKPHLPAGNGAARPIGTSGSGQPIYQAKMEMPPDYEALVQSFTFDLDASHQAFPPQVVSHAAKAPPAKAVYNYLDGDPHHGVIPQKKLDILEKHIARQRPLAGPSPPDVPVEEWVAHSGWTRAVNGSRSRMEDALKPDEQPTEKDWRPDSYGKWKPLMFANEKQTQLPTVQYPFPAPDRFSGQANDVERDNILEKRRRLVRGAFLHAWEAYKRSAWGHDEVKPVSGGPSDSFNGWGASIVDALDTLLIMELPEEYNYARQHVRDVDFHLVGGSRSAYGSSDGRIPVFETAIRYLGGLLSAYDLSGDELMRDRGEELAQLIMPSFETMTGVPVGRIRFDDKAGRPASGSVIFSEAASMLLEFTRLWQVTGNRTYFDRVHRITDWLQYNMTGSPDRLGALLPASLFPDRGTFYGWYTWGGMIDSAYEYLVKEHQLLGGRVQQYGNFFIDVMDSTQRWLLRSVKSVPDTTLLLIGQSNGKTFVPKLEHLTCFAGGSIGLGAKLLSRKNDLDVAQRLTETCWWAYNSTATGIGPEDMVFYRETDTDRFESTTLSTGSIRRGRPRGAPVVGVKTVSADYRGRPETIESVLYMWRITGDKRWQERGWQMFSSWITHGLADYGISSLGNVLYVPVSQTDSMESYVFAETFKYYYLLFSPPNLISLDDYVFSTEAHPLLLPKNGKWGIPGKGPRPFWDASTITDTSQTDGEYNGGENGPIGGLTRAQKNFVYQEWLRKEHAAEAKQREAAQKAEKARLEAQKAALMSKQKISQQLRRMISMVTPAASASSLEERKEEEHRERDGVEGMEVCLLEEEDMFAELENVDAAAVVLPNAHEIVIYDDAPVVAQTSII
jgi:mannosyl-oligosaccharide alpha-1,2-mannosidase